MYQHSPSLPVGSDHERELEELRNVLELLGYSQEEHVPQPAENKGMNVA
jgi:hypothetical protein